MNTEFSRPKEGKSIIVDEKIKLLNIANSNTTATLFEYKGHLVRLELSEVMIKSPVKILDSDGKHLYDTRTRKSSKT